MVDPNLPYAIWCSLSLQMVEKFYHLSRVRYFNQGAWKVIMNLWIYLFIIYFLCSAYGRHCLPFAINCLPYSINCLPFAINCLPFATTFVYQMSCLPRGKMPSLSGLDNIGSKSTLMMCETYKTFSWDDYPQRIKHTIIYLNALFPTVLETLITNLNNTYLYW